MTNVSRRTGALLYHRKSFHADAYSIDVLQPAKPSFRKVSIATEVRIVVEIRVQMIKTHLYGRSNVYDWSTDPSQISAESRG